MKLLCHFHHRCCVSVHSACLRW